jgi:hypothetical protein
MDGPSESIYRDRGRIGRGVSEKTGGRCGGRKRSRWSPSRSAVKFCAQRRSEKKVVQWRPAVKSERDAVEWRRWHFQSLPTTLNLIGFRVMRWGVRLRRTSYWEPLAPTSLYSAGWRGPASHGWAGRPRLGHRSKAQQPPWSQFIL